MGTCRTWGRDTTRVVSGSLRPRSGDWKRTRPRERRKEPEQDGTRLTTESHTFPEPGDKSRAPPTYPVPGLPFTKVSKPGTKSVIPSPLPFLSIPLGVDTALAQNSRGCTTTPSKTKLLTHLTPRKPGCRLRLPLPPPKSDLSLNLSSFTKNPQTVHDPGHDPRP